MGMAFPLFVLMACESDPHEQYQKGGPTHTQKLTNGAFSLQVLECLVHIHSCLLVAFRQHAVAALAKILCSAPACLSCMIHRDALFV